MSEQDIQKIMYALGCLETNIKNLTLQFDKISEQINKLQNNGCVIGAENKKEILDLQKCTEEFKNIWRKAVLIMVGVGVGSVGAKEALTRLLYLITGIN